MKYSLKSCPFCGGTPYIESRSRAYMKGETIRVAYIRCLSCSVKTAKFPISMGHRKAIDMAAYNWNARYRDETMCSADDHM